MTDDKWFRVQIQDGKKKVFDPIRKRFVALTPEEEVRQNTLYLLINTMKVPQSLIAVEYAFELNERKKRSDIVVFNREGKAMMIIECKAGNIAIGQAALDQAARYNFVLQVRFLMLTNGTEQYICKIGETSPTLEFIHFLPDFDYLSQSI
jgi:hypothetical protein